jgi:hypothetical protein
MGKRHPSLTLIETVTTKVSLIATWLCEGMTAIVAEKTGLGVFVGVPVARGAIASRCWLIIACVLRSNVNIKNAAVAQTMIAIMLCGAGLGLPKCVPPLHMPKSKGGVGGHPGSKPSTGDLVMQLDILAR